MSLNGLDSPDVQDAYQTAVAEAGGWFLLKYTSRDSVELLGRGKHGVSEARNAITAYTESSPLYGMIIYRRRKTLIKYIPEGTSRLLQARTAVHFQDVLEKYSPYETLLEISTADALNDTSLAASFHLHTASPSPSASRLDEIQEDEDDGPPESSTGNAGHASASSATAVAGAQRYSSRTRALKRVERADRSMSSLHLGKSALTMSPASTPPASPGASSASSKPQVLGSDNLPAAAAAASASASVTRTVESPLASASASAGEYVTTTTQIDDSTPQPISTSTSTSASASTRTSICETTCTVPADEADRTPSPEPPSVPPKASKASKALPEPEPPTVPPKTPKALPHLPATELQKEAESSLGPTSMSEHKPVLRSQSLDDEPYDFSKYDALFKPKVKLAPRPVFSPAKVKRPAVARVSAVPASFRPSTKKQEPKQEPARPKSQGQSLSRAPAVASPEDHVHIPSLPPIPDTPEYKPRPVSRASIKSAPSHKSSGMTPDKIRLMKAVELRRRQLRKSQDQVSPAPVDDDVPEVPTLPQRSSLRERKDSLGTQHQESPQAEQSTPLARVPEIEAEQEQVTTDDESQHQSSKADSGISLRYGTPDTQHTDTVGEEAACTDDGKQTTGRGMSRVAHVEAAPRHDANSPAARSTPAGSVPVDTQADASSTASFTPTEKKPGNPELGSDEAAVLPTILTEDGLRPLTPSGEPPAKAASSAANIEQSSSQPSEGALEEPPSSPKRHNSDLAKRRRGLVEPLHIETSSGNPDDFGSDDEELLEELHSATVQEAKPISMARSPVAVGFPGGRRRSADTVASVRSVQIARASAIPVERTSETLGGLSPDSAESPSSASSLTPPDAVAGFMRNVSSGISMRIRALNEHSSKETSSPAFNWHSQPPTPGTSPNGLSTFEFLDRKSNRKSPAASRSTSYRKQGRNSANQTPVTTPGTESAPVWSVQHDPSTNRNSVTVTTRITRTTTADDTEDEQGPLQKSEVLINHQREKAHPPPISTDWPATASAPALSPVHSTNSFEKQSPRSSSKFGKHQPSKSQSLDDFPPPPSNRVLSNNSLSPSDENVAPKEGSRTSRFFRRMSTLAGPKKKGSSNPMASSTSLVSNEASSPLKTSPVQRESVATEKSDTPPAVVVGDLNVQLPDSLLWKRRIVTIDDAGYLQFAIASAMEIHKGIAQKRFSLAAFSMPYAPDLDRQELDHSIVLEFQDGTAVQIACEDAVTQRQVLSVLKTYWKAYQAQTTQL